jgi:hypothetical protein
MTDNQNSALGNTITSAARVLIFVDAAAWIGFGIAAGAGWIPGLPEGAVRWQMAVLAVVFGAAMLFLYLLSRRKTWAIYLLMGLLALISLLSLTDQVGLLDWVVYAINLAALVLLILEIRKQG